MVCTKSKSVDYSKWRDVGCHLDQSTPGDWVSHVTRWSFHLLTLSHPATSKASQSERSLSQGRRRLGPRLCESHSFIGHCRQRPIRAVQTNMKCNVSSLLQSRRLIRLNWEKRGYRQVGHGEILACFLESFNSLRVNSRA